jgi:hypothetical protein
MTAIAAQRVFQTPRDAHYFFGYFNTPQVCANERRILALRCDFLDRVPDGNDRAEVGYFDLAEAEPAFRKLGETRAFNWQQGCMLQFRGPDYAASVIYNSFDGEKFIAEIVDVDTGRKRILDHAIYAMFPDGERALSLDFARHYWCRRGYSYGNIVDEAKNRPVVPGDGVWLVDVASGATKKLIAIEDILALNPVGSMDGGTHYLEHMTVNPAGTRFAFLHRWKYEGGIHSRLCVADSDGGNIRILNDSGRMSHYCWRDNDRLIGYGGMANPINMLRRHKTLIKGVFNLLLPHYHKLVKDTSGLAKALTGDSYIEIDAVSGRLRPIAHALRADDGHPAMLPGGAAFVTDTYARGEHGQKPRLYAFDLETERETLLDELDSIAAYDATPVRCDLHPRVSPRGGLVTIDTMDGGMRGVYGYRIGLS